MILNFTQPYKECSTFSSGDHFVLRIKAILATLIEGLRRNIWYNHFELGPAVQKKMSFKDLI